MFVSAFAAIFAITFLIIAAYWDVRSFGDQIQGRDARAGSGFDSGHTRVHRSGVHGGIVQQGHRASRSSLVI